MMRLKLDTASFNSPLFTDLTNTRPLDVHTWSDYPDKIVATQQYFDTSFNPLKLKKTVPYMGEAPKGLVVSKPCVS